MDDAIARMPKETVEYLQQMGFHFDKARMVWVKNSVGRIWRLSFEDTRDHDLAWVKSRVAEFATQPL